MADDDDDDDDDDDIYTYIYSYINLYLFIYSYIYIYIYIIWSYLSKFCHMLLQPVSPQGSSDNKNKPTQKKQSLNA